MKLPYTTCARVDAQPNEIIGAYRAPLLFLPHFPPLAKFTATFVSRTRTLGRARPGYYSFLVAEARTKNYSIARYSLRRVNDLCGVNDVS